MKKRGLIFLIVSTFFNSVILHAQKVNVAELQYHSALEKDILSQFYHDRVAEALALQLISDKEASEEVLQEHTANLNHFIEKLKKKRARVASDQQFFSHLFYKTHQKFLKQYTPFSSLHTLLAAGQYDCLSATALYALILNAFDTNYNIIETDYHIYLLVEADNGIVLFESTDGLYGFITDQKEITSRLAAYKEGNATASDVQGNRDYYQFSNSIDNQIDLLDLAGLHYYNAAVKAYNQQSLEEAVVLLEKAAIFYPSGRMQEFGLLVARTLLNDEDTPSTEKAAYMERIRSVVKAETAVAALYE